MRRISVFIVFLGAGVIAFGQPPRLPGSPQSADLSSIQPPCSVGMDQPAPSSTAQLFVRRDFKNLNACPGASAAKTPGSTPPRIDAMFNWPCMNPGQGPVFVGQLDEPQFLRQMVPSRGKGRPIPGQWPNLKFLPIPTQWPALKMELIAGSGAHSIPSSGKAK